MFTASFEHTHSYLAHPYDQNVLWLMCRMATRIRPSTMPDELNIVRYQNAMYSRLISSLVGLLYSIGWSLIFHVMNFTGSHLIEWSTQTGSRVSLELERMLSSSGSLRQQPFRAIACNFVRQNTPWFFDHTSFQGILYNGGHQPGVHLEG